MPKLCEYQNCRERATYGPRRGCPLRCNEHKENMKLISLLCMCGKARPLFNEPDETTAICCVSCKTETMVDVKHKRCQCGLARPIYNEPGQSLAICCASCKTGTMIDIISKRCRCGKAIPTFNEPDQTSPICCASCKTENMVNVINKRCQCGKAIPTFNEPGQTSPICCVSCKTDTMVNVKSKRCICGLTQPIYNEPGQTTAICCASCKTDTMVNVKSKRCRCGLAQPNFNEPGQTSAICCASCKTETMINVTNKRCICGKTQPNFNEPGQTSAICCSSCRTETMIDIINKRCRCGKARPHYNESGQKPAICCYLCKTNTMVNVINKRCPGLINNNETCPYNHIGNPKYKNYCIECYRRNFPLDPLTFQIRCKTKEIAVRDYINANLEGFQHDKPLSTSHCECNIRRRIDHRKLINNTLLVIETDENQHKSYDQMDEETRYDDLYMAFSGKWVYIRFNPDKYVSKNGKNKNPMIYTRLPVLLDEIKKQIWRIETEQNSELVERVYLFYDGYD